MNEALLSTYPLAQYGVEILIIVALIVFGRVLLSKLAKRVVGFMETRSEEDGVGMGERAQTIATVLSATGNVVIYTIALFMFLDLFGVDIRPVLAGAGIVGLAVGFGTQTLVKDFVSGLFIILEDQYRVGEKIKIGTIEGKVKKVTMRSTILDDDENIRYFISNGTVNNVHNYSRREQ